MQAVMFGMLFIYVVQETGFTYLHPEKMSETGSTKLPEATQSFVSVWLLVSEDERRQIILRHNALDFAGQDMFAMLASGR